MLVDGDHLGDGLHNTHYWLTLTVCKIKVNKILVSSESGGFFVKVNTPLHDFAGIDWSAQQSQGELFA